MVKKIKNNKKFQKLIDNYRLVVLNESSFEEKFSFRLNRLNLFVVGSLFAIFIITATIFLIAYTPLKEYIPGYSSSKLKKDASELVYKVGSLQKVIQVNNLYLDNIKEVFTGKVMASTFDKDSLLNVVKTEIDTINLAPSADDLRLREEVAQSDRYSLFEEATKQTALVFFSPITGQITEQFNINDRHYGIDVAVANNEPIKAVANGTVIFSEWTAETGHVIILEHPNNFTSIYKHNASLLKQQGDVVQSGEVIATAGSTGEYSTGPHLHFELWNEGNPVNPTNFIDFE